MSTVMNLSFLLGLLVGWLGIPLVMGMFAKVSAKAGT